MEARTHDEGAHAELPDEHALDELLGALRGQLPVELEHDRVDTALPQQLQLVIEPRE